MDYGLHFFVIGILLQAVSIIMILLGSDFPAPSTTRLCIHLAASILWGIGSLTLFLSGKVGPKA